MGLEVRESQIEDVLVGAHFLTREILGLEDEPRLLARQMVLPSGRLDLLYAYRTNLLLVELKAVSFHRSFVDQVLGYKNDLLEQQRRGKLLGGEIHPYLLCPDVTHSQRSSSTERGVRLENYDPGEVLNFFYRNFKPITLFTQIKPIDIGIWNIHLIHDLLDTLEYENSVKKLRTIVPDAQKTLYNKIRFAFELRLLSWTPTRDEISLSDAGREYVALQDQRLPSRLSDEQAEFLRIFVMQNPYESAITLGIAAMVESVFALAKNTYPVHLTDLQEFFVTFAGKHFDWKTDKAKFSAMRMYSNYAVDLGLLAKASDTIFLTPEGFRFTVQMQMHKNLKMVEVMRMF